MADGRNINRSKVCTKYTCRVSEKNMCGAAPMSKPLLGNCHAQSQTSTRKLRDACSSCGSGRHSLNRCIRCINGDAPSSSRSLSSASSAASFQTCAVVFGSIRSCRRTTLVGLGHHAQTHPVDSSPLAACLSVRHRSSKYRSS